MVMVWPCSHTHGLQRDHTDSSAAIPDSVHHYIPYVRRYAQPLHHCRTTLLQGCISSRQHALSPVSEEPVGVSCLQEEPLSAGCSNTQSQISCRKKFCLSLVHRCRPQLCCDVKQPPWCKHLSLRMLGVSSLQKLQDHQNDSLFLQS